MSRYDPRVSTAGGNRRRLRERALGFDDAVLQRMARISVEADCAEGRHRAETDSDTGDEVCRFCGEVDPS